MSTFGDGTFKQGVYEEIQWRMKDANLYTGVAVQEVLEIASYMLAGIGHDELHEQIREQVKTELLEKLK